MSVREECKRFDSCGAPLCPLDRDSLTNGLWYSDEESCESVEFRMMPWIKRQRKIARKVSTSDTYFTLEMLNQNIVIRHGLQGLDPDRDERSQLEQWLKAHGGKRPISEEQRMILAERMKNIQFKKKVIPLEL